MFVLSRVFNLFKVSADADLSEDSAFKSAFSNVVNILMLIQSLVLGIRTLVHEDPVLSSLNLVFSLFFVTYFVATYIVKVGRFINTIERIAIFLYFIVIYITCSRYAIVGVTITIYPFIAIILSGRHVGAVLSFVQAGVILAYYFFSVQIFGDGGPSTYSLSGTLTIVILQVVNIFVYYVAVRWLSGLVYDKNREVAMANEEIALQRDLTNRLAQSVDKPLRDISEASAVLVGERLNPMQAELSSIVRSAALNAINNVNAVRKASKLSIPIVPVEIVKFNICSLLSALLKLYRPKSQKVSHIFSLGGGAPEEVVGNSILTRQVFLNVFDALDAQLGLADCGMRISVIREDLVVNDIILRFTITVEHSLQLDRREVTYHEGSLMELLNLDVTRRIVESEGGLMTAVSEGETAKIEFTVRYKPVVDDEVADPDIVRLAKAGLNAAIPMRQATLLVVSEDDDLWASVAGSLQPCFAQVRRAQNRDMALRVFSNVLVDAVLVDAGLDPDCGARLLASVREAESGLVRKVPVIGLVDPSQSEQMTTVSDVGYDACITLPFNSIEAVETLRPYFA